MTSSAQPINVRSAGAPSRTRFAPGFGFKVFLYLVLIALALIFMAPFVYMVSLSFMTYREAVQWPPSFLPSEPTLEGYRRIFDVWPVWRLVYNSFQIAILATVGSLLSNSMAAFAFARLEFRGRNLLFAIVLATMMVPAQVRLIPQFIIFNWFDWINTHAPLIVPAWFTSAFGIFLLRQFFLTVPKDLEDAAIIDGCNRLQVYWRIFLPLAGPALATLAIFNFMGAWNNLLGPIIYLNSLDKFPIVASIAFMTNQYAEAQWLVPRMALAALSILPLVALYLALQRYFVQGVVISGMKG